MMILLTLPSSSPQDPLGVIFMFAAMLLHLCSSFMDLQLHSPFKQSTQGTFYTYHTLFHSSLLPLKPVMPAPGLRFFN